MLKLFSVFLCSPYLTGIYEAVFSIENLMYAILKTNGVTKKEDSNGQNEIQGMLFRKNVKYYTLYILLLFFVFIRSIFMYKFYLLFVLLTLILLY